MKKRRINNMLVLMLSMVLCAGCGSGQNVRTAGSGTGQQETEKGQDGENVYASYDGYAYCQADGQVKYALDTTDGLRLYCYFQSDSPEYEQVIYDLTTAPGQEASVDVTGIVQEPDIDLTDSFSKCHLAFYPDRVVLSVERKEAMLAGGEAENLMTGEYTLVPSDWKPQVPKTGEQTGFGTEENGDTPSETADFMAPYESRELVALARAFYLKENNFLAPEDTCTDNGDGTTTIQLYENVQTDEDMQHTATSAWYTVDAYGRGKDDVMETQITLPGLSLAELAAYIGTPETLTYIQEAEGRNEWKITDAQTISACLKALQQIRVGEKTDLRAADAGEMLCFEMADSSTWTLDFENGNLVRNGNCYETEGWNKVQKVLKEALSEEGMQ